MERTDASDSYSPHRPHFIRVNESVEAIERALLEKPAPDTEPSGTCADFDICTRESYDMPAFYTVMDGYAAVYTRGFALERRSYRFVFPDQGPILYHRESYDVDFQAVARPPKNLIGLDEIARDQEALEELVYVANCMRDAIPNSWRTHKNSKVQVCG